MWIRGIAAGALQLFASQAARAQITLADFKVPVRYVADVAVDLSAITPYLPARAVGYVGKAVLLYSDAKERKARGATTVQAFRDQGVVAGLGELATAFPLGEFRPALKPLAIAATKSGVNAFIGNQADWFYTSLQGAVAPYTSLWQEKGRSVRAQTGGGSLQDGDCSTKLAVGQEVLSLAKTLVPPGCGVSGMPDDKAATTARIAVSCNNAGQQLSMRYGLSKLSDSQIGVTMQFMIGGQGGAAQSTYEKCDSKSGEQSQN